MALPKSFDKYASVLDARLKASIDGDGLLLYDMLRYHMGWVDDCGASISGSSGKGLRPMMCLWACEAVGGNWEDALPAAVSLELVHNFSLIHDDIQDGDEERRHKPTVWAIWGKAQGINAGDSMRGLATLTLVNGGCGYPKEKLVSALAGLEKACLEMIEGQYLDISFEERTETTTDQYLDMISRKTGALIECAFYLGALIGVDSPDIVQSFKQCGRELGLVFQIRDDVLGVWGKEETTGKPVASDIRRKKMCLPLVYALHESSGENRKVVQSLFQAGEPSEDKVNEVLAVLGRLGAREYCQSLAAEQRERALSRVDSMDISSTARGELEGLAAFFLEREH